MNWNGTAGISISIEPTSPVTWSTLSFRRYELKFTSTACESRAGNRIRAAGRLRLADQRVNSAMDRAPNDVRVGNPSIHIRSEAVMYTCSVRVVTPIPLPSTAACGARRRQCPCTQSEQPTTDNCQGCNTNVGTRRAPSCFNTARGRSGGPRIDGAEMRGRCAEQPREGQVTITDDA
jgi:hypothetical protein